MFRKRTIVVYFLSLMVLHLSADSGTSYAATPDQYDYPELSVVPRASDRIQAEANQEAERKWTTFLPIQISSLTTLASGVASLNSTDVSYGLAGIGVGGGWLVLSTWMAMSYEPYTSASRDVKAMAKSSTRDQLARERAAEERLAQISAVGEKMKWLSVVTNLGASVYMLTYKSGGSGVDASMGFRIVSAASAFAPLLFGFHWHDVNQEQKEYKKRIYAPVAVAPTLLPDPVSKKLIPGLALSFVF